MLVFQLPYSLLYADNLVQLSKSDLNLELDKLSESNAQLLSNRLRSPYLLAALAYSQQLLLPAELTANLKPNIQILAAELNLYANITNCFIRKGVLNYIGSTSAGVKQIDPTIATQTTPIANLVLAHGLRWGWSITEQVGRYFILTAETEYRVDGSTCSCHVKDCIHLQYIREVIKLRQDLDFTIVQLSSPTLL